MALLLPRYVRDLMKVKPDVLNSEAAFMATHDEEFQREVEASYERPAEVLARLRSAGTGGRQRKYDSAVPAPAPGEEPDLSDEKDRQAAMVLAIQDLNAMPAEGEIEHAQKHIAGF